LAVQTFDDVKSTKNKNSVLVMFWLALGDDDTGKPLEVSTFSDKTVHMFGTIGGATISIEGSNDPRANPTHPSHASAQWQILTDPAGNIISTTADNKLEQILENPWWIRPITSGGSGTDMDIYLLLKKG